MAHFSNYRAQWAHRFQLISSLILGGAIFSACADTAPPPGGPEDKQAPTILATVPMADQLNVAAGSTIIVTFSEPLNPRSLDKNVYVAPRPSGKIQTHVDGPHLTVELPQPFADSVTYVLTLGSAIQDLRGNTLGKSRSISFTRGNHIDSNRIAGVVTENNRGVKGALVGFFKDSIANVVGALDSLFPNYLTQTGDSGNFELTNLPSGKGVLLAFQDRNGDERFQFPGEKVAVTTRPVTCGVGDNSNLELRLKQYDTTRSELRGVTSADNGLVRIAFSKPVSPAFLAKNLKSISLKSTDDTTVVFFAATFKDLSGPDRQKFDLYFPALPPGNYLFNLTATRTEPDSATWTDVAPYARAQLVDTTKPRMESPAPGRTYVSWETRDFTVNFSEPVVIDVDAADVAQITNIGGGRVNAKMEFLDRFRLRATFVDTPNDGSEYTITVDSAHMYDAVGNHLTAPTSQTIRFYPTDSLGEIIVRISNRMNPDYRGAYLYTFTRLPSTVFTRSESARDSISIKLPGGSYALEVTEDSHEGSMGKRYDGNIYPLRFAEPRSFFPDTITVRPRFVTGGVTVILE